MATAQKELKTFLEGKKGKEFEPGVRRLWRNFDHITRIPRQSEREGWTGEFLIDFAEKRKALGITFEKDSIGNVLLLAPATNGKQNSPKIILQGHQDMVCLGEPNPGEYGVKAIISKDGKRVTTDETTLGADNGIGGAAMLSIIDEPIEHGPLALLFTVQEETGLVGAKNMGLKQDLSGYHFVMNLDSEVEGEATIGCAGGGYSIISLPIKKEPSTGKKLLKFNLTEGLGGHSGIVIHEKRVNAVKELSEIFSDILLGMTKKADLNLVSIKAGVIKDEKTPGKVEVPIRNAIPKEAEAVIAIDPKDEAKIMELVQDKFADIKAEHKNEKNLGLYVNENTYQSAEMLNTESTENVLNLIEELPHGAIERITDPVVGEMTMTSANLAIVRTEDDHLRVDMMSRSADESKLFAVRNDIADCVLDRGGTIDQLEPYPSWNPSSEDDFYTMAQKVYQQIFQKSLKMSKTHGGLELGYFKKNGWRSIFEFRAFLQ